MCKEDQLAEQRWVKTFKIVDACLILYDKGMPVKDISWSLGLNEADVENNVKLSKAFPKGKRWRNVPIDVYVWASKYPDPEKMLEVAWQKKWYANDFKQDFKKFKGESPVPISERERQTPIEVALGVDEEGMTTAKKLFDFLELDKSNYSRWVKKIFLKIFLRRKM